MPMKQQHEIQALLLVPLLGLLFSIDASASTNIGRLLADTCGDCHGAEGASTEPDIPTISGMSEQYIISNLTSYKNKERPCPEVKYHKGVKKGKVTDMCVIAGNLSDEDIAAVAKNLSLRRFVRVKQPFDSAKAKKGRELHDEKCDKCHSFGGTVSEEDSGILAGQWKPYLEMTFKHLVSGRREMPTKMKQRIDKLQPGDIDALINYYISQQ